MKITKETAERIDRIIKTDDLSVSVERKKVFVLSEIAIILAGLLDAKLAELGALGEDTEIEKDPNDLSPIMPSFDDNDEPFFTKNGRRVDK